MVRVWGSKSVEPLVLLGLKGQEEWVRKSGVLWLYVGKMGAVVCNQGNECLSLSLLAPPGSCFPLTKIKWKGEGRQPR